MIADLQEHPLRQRLNNEFHARPPIPLLGATLVSHLVFKHSATAAEAARDNLTLLTRAQNCNAIESSDSHMMLDTASFRMRWELHTEFSSYTFFRPLKAGEPLDPDATAFAAVHPDWLAGIPGRLMVATHVELRSTSEISPESGLASLTQSGRTMVAARVADEAAWICTDFKIADGCSRFLVLDERMTQRQAGRTVQRLVEIETYRMMALLALPLGWLGVIYLGSLGALLIQGVENGLLMMKADVYLYPLVTSTIIFVAVLLDSLRNRVVDRLRSVDVLCEICDPVFYDRDGEKLRA